MTGHILLILLGLALFAGGGFVTFAYGMSDDPAAAQAPSNRSCLTAVAGLILAIGTIIQWVLS